MKGNANKLNRAIELAIKHHAGATDWDGVPYIVHVTQVAAGVPTGNVDAAIVAWLHDTVEDTDLTLDEIRKEFGDKIADGVDAVSRRADETYAEFIYRCGDNELGRLVKLADLASNTRDDRKAGKPSLVARYEKAKEVLGPA